MAHKDQLHNRLNAQGAIVLDIENPEAVATAAENDRSSEIIHDLCQVPKKLVVGFNSQK